MSRQKATITKWITQDLRNKSRSYYEINASRRKIGVDDRIRTGDDWNHNPGLYLLSYTHHKLVVMARLAGLEPATLGLEGRCSIRLSYKRKWSG